MDSDDMVIDLQSNLLDQLKTRIVAPLIPAASFGPSLTRLRVDVEVNGASYSIPMQLIAAIPLEEIGPVVGEVSGYRDEITAAVDFAFQGF